jgi:hypothetical protein
MTYKNLEEVFGSILLLTLTGTAWANAPSVSTVRTPSREPMTIIHDNGAAPLPANENSTDFTFSRTGIFGGVPDKVTTTRPVEKVHTGLFWSPQVLSGDAQGYSLGNVLWFGALRPPDDFDVANGTGERHDVQRRRLRKHGSRDRTWLRSRRGR